MSLTLQFICMVFPCIFPRFNLSKNWGNQCCHRKIILTIITWQSQSTVLNILDPIHRSPDSVTGWDNSLSLCSQNSHMMRTRWASASSARMGNLVISASIRVWNRECCLVPAQGCAPLFPFALSFPQVQILSVSSQYSLLLLCFETPIYLKMVRISLFF